MKRINEIIKGLEILSKYSDHIACEHDELYAGPQTDKRLNEEEKKQLEDMNWLFEEGVGWSIFV